MLHELTPLAGSLEDAYLALTEDDVEYHAGSLDDATATKEPRNEPTTTQSTPATTAPTAPG